MDFVHMVSVKLRCQQTSPRVVLCTILVFLVATSYLRDNLAGASHSWWMRLGVLPVYTYISAMLLPTILLINTYIILNDNLPLTPSTLLRNTRLTWRHTASAMFYQNLARQGYHLTLWCLGAVSDALPAWLWWLDAVAKPARLAIHLFLLHQEMIWIVCLVFLALSILGRINNGYGQQLPAAGLGFDMWPWMNFAEAIVRDDRATGLVLTFCFAGARAVYHGAVAGMLPAVLHYFLTCAGTMLVIAIYSYFTCTNFIKQIQKAGVAAEVGNQQSPPETSVQITPMEGHPQMQ